MTTIMRPRFFRKVREAMADRRADRLAAARGAVSAPTTFTIAPAWLTQADRAAWHLRQAESEHPDNLALIQRHRLTAALILATLNLTESTSR